nr:MAG TPA: hypothetical protein [Caudoviricetes sp.]
MHIIYEYVNTHCSVLRDIFFISRVWFWVSQILFFKFFLFFSPF